MKKYKDDPTPGYEIPKYTLPENFVNAFRNLLLDPKLDKDYKAYTFVLPTVSEIVEKLVEADPLAIFKV